jgi:inner membrane transporter RhtA
MQEKPITSMASVTVPSARHGLVEAVRSSARRFPFVLTLLSMSSIQFGAAIAAPVMNAYGSLLTTWLRLCWAALLLVLIVRPPLRTYTASHWRAAGALGASMACMTLCFFAAIQRIPLGLAVAIEFLGPLCVASLGIRRLRASLWPLLAVMGVLRLAHDRAGWYGDTLGILLALCAAMAVGGYIVLTKKVGAVFQGMEGLSLSLLVAAAIAAPFGLSQVEHATITTVAATAGLAVLVPLLPYGLEMIALRAMTASSFGILMSLEPAIGALFGFLVLHQSMDRLQIIGTILVVCASAGAVVASRKNGNEPMRPSPGSVE